MTGLNIERDSIMEVACLITDSELNIVAQQPDIVIHQSDNVLNNMDDWCTNQHGTVNFQFTQYIFNLFY